MIIWFQLIPVTLTLNYTHISDLILISHYSQFYIGNICMLIELIQWLIEHQKREECTNIDIYHKNFIQFNSIFFIIYSMNE